jgi:Pyruvate/2-oxoacid:ferredoxin oxidoreductase gamma subunit
VAGVDAVQIALKYGLGSKMAPIVNTVIIGAFARLAGDLALSNLLEAIETGVPVNPKQNMAAAEAAYHAVFRISGDVDAD